MPIYLSKTGYGYTYKREKLSKGKNRKLNLKFILFILMAIALVVSLVIFIPKVFKKNNGNEERFLYALNILSTTNFDEANLTSTYVQNQGASGYIHKEDNEYKVYLSCYYSEEDANKVMTSLNENGYKVSLTKINFPLINTKENDFDNAINIFYDTYLKLYDLSIQYDKNEISSINLKENVNMLIKTNEQIINNFNDFYKGSSVSKIIYTRIYLEMLQENLSQLTQKTENLSSEIKSHYFYIIFLYKQLLQNIQ